MIRNSALSLAFFLGFFWACTSSNGHESSGSSQNASVKTGASVLIEAHLDELDGKRVGLVMNPTARVKGTHMLDTLLSLNVNITALFAPEHGFRGESGAGEVIEDGVDQATGLPVYSLYGETKKPTPRMLRNVDLLIFDMQDVGARFYTYNVTLGRLLEAAAAEGIPVWVLDRPNPAGGDYVAGWMLKDEYRSFVGAWPVPMAHGMTLGELAKMMIGEEWIGVEQPPELKVIPMEGWQREMKWGETGLEWYPPSPNLPSFEHAYIYLGTVLFEGTGLSEGRGTDDPFLTVGSPDTEIPEEALSDFQKQFPSVGMERITFTPRSIPGKAAYPKHEGESCKGLRLNIRDYDKVDPVTFGVRLLEFIMQHTDGAVQTDFIYKLAGSEAVSSYSIDWEDEVEAFRQARKPYLLYD